MSYELKHIIKNKVYESLKDVYSDIKVSIDINPTSLM
jgi:primosomal protein N' (replication factor Y)